MAENVDNTLLLQVLKEIRKEQRDQRTLLLQTSEYTRKLERLMESRLGAVDQSLAAINARFGAVEPRFSAVDQRLSAIDQRISGLKDDLELMIKSELMGALGNFEVRMMGLIEERLARKD
jgi:hypothetical protein